MQTQTVFPVVVQVKQEDIEYVLGSGLVSGGVTYWARYVDCEYPGDIESAVFNGHVVKITLRQPVSDDSKKLKYELTLENVKTGLEIMANIFPNSFSDLQSTDRRDMCTGDVLVQCCLFGDEIRSTGDLIFC